MKRADFPALGARILETISRSGGTAIIESYNQYRAKLPDLMKALHLQDDDATYADKTQLIEQWLKFTATA